MARKLKTFTTSAGFFDLAVAAPSMKAALAAWGSRMNLFRLGTARQSQDPAVVAATMAKPGVVLRRPVGSRDAFSEHPGLPSRLGGGPAPARARRRQEAASHREAAELESRRLRRERAVAKAEAEIDAARQRHQESLEQLERNRAALDRRIEAERRRWQAERQRLDDALRIARSSG